MFGGLDLHGFEVKPVITHLAATVEKGDSVITVDADVEASGWNVSHSVVFIILYWIDYTILYLLYYFVYIILYLLYYIVIYYIVLYYNLPSYVLFYCVIK